MRHRKGAALATAQTANEGQDISSFGKTNVQASKTKSPEIQRASGGTVLVPYDAACRLLAEARSVDDVKDILNTAAAMAEYARRAKNRDAEADALEIRLRAMRCLDQLRKAQKATVGLAKGGQPYQRKRKATGLTKNPVATLAEAGIDKNLAHEARKLGSLSEEQFTEKVVQARDTITSAVGRVESITIIVPRAETAKTGEFIEFTVPQWNAMPPSEQRKYLDPESFPSSAKLNKEEGDGTDYAQHSYSTIVGCKHACQIDCWAKVETLRFPKVYPHGFNNPVFRPRMLSAPRNTSVPAAAERDGRFKNVSSNFMSDMFGAWVPPAWIKATLEVERADPRWIFLHLTKFPGRLLEFEFSPNMWIGTSVDWQQRVENVERVFAQLREKYGPDLTLWFSIEPMLDQLKFTRLDLVDFIAIGGAARSMRTPEWRPPHRWIMDVIEQVDKQTGGRCKIFEKTNLYGNRTLELPGGLLVPPDYEQVAPDIFDYLNPSRRKLLEDGT